MIVLDKPSVKLRGILGTWMLEVRPGVFVGDLSALVRERIWDTVSNEEYRGAILISSSDKEQGYEMRMQGVPLRRVVDYDGYQLIEIANIAKCQEDILDTTKSAF